LSQTDIDPSSDTHQVTHFDPQKNQELQMKRKASSPLERSVKRIATSPGSGRELMQMIRERNVAMLRARSATKIQALFRGYILRRRLGQRAQSLFRAKATAFMRCHRDHGMFPEMKAEYHDFLWQCLKQAVTSI
tara:strand:- start:141 stop:542 length:402 start_codon:yes stop_codon:yes gene_type:complete